MIRLKKILKRVIAVLRLLYIFNRELFISSITVLGYIVRPKPNFTPGIFAYETKLRSDWEVTILSCLICLTPGTLTLEVSGDKGILYIHAIDTRDVDAVRKQISDTFEKAIMEVTR